MIFSIIVIPHARGCVYKVSQSCLALCDPWTEGCQVPLSLGFFSQEHWSRLSVPFLGDFPNLQLETASPAL